MQTFCKTELNHCLFRGLQAGRHFQDSKTQSTGLAPGSERWALKCLDLGGGGQTKKEKKKKLKPVALFFSPPPPRPGSFGFGTWAFSFSLYKHCARVIFPAEAFSSVCILCIIGSILYTAWIFVGLTKFLLYTSGRYKILVKSLLTVRNGKPKDSGL